MIQIKKMHRLYFNFRYLCRKYTTLLILLLSLLQRVPVLLKSFAEARFATTGIVQLCRWTITGIAGMGVHHTLSGATRLVMDPASPVQATVGEEIQIVLAVTGAPSVTRSYRIKSGMPDGLTPTNGSVEVASAGAIQISGSPTESGDFTVSATAYDKTSGSGGDNWSFSFQIQVEAASLIAPTSLLASTNEFSDKIVVSWDAASGADSYDIYRSETNNSSDAVLIGTSSTTSYDDIDSSLSPVIEYYYWVKANSGSNSSEFSSLTSGSLFYVFKDVPMDGVWRVSPWLGYFYDPFYPWVYHSKFTWLYIYPISETEFFAYELSLGWLYFESSIYDVSSNTWFIYSYNEGSWLSLMTDQSDSLKSTFFVYDGTNRTIVLDL